MPSRPRRSTASWTSRRRPARTPPAPGGNPTPRCRNASAAAEHFLLSRGVPARRGKEFGAGTPRVRRSGGVVHRLLGVRQIVLVGAALPGGPLVPLRALARDVVGRLGVLHRVEGLLLADLGVPVVVDLPQ